MIRVTRSDEKVVGQAPTNFPFLFASVDGERVYMRLCPLKTVNDITIWPPEVLGQRTKRVSTDAQAWERRTVVSFTLKNMC